MRSGALRHTISIQEATETTDSEGGYTTAWANVSGMGSVAAAIWPLASKEIIDQLGHEFHVTHKFRVRYQSGITTKMQIVWGSRTFNMISITNPGERNIYLEMLGTEET